MGSNKKNQINVRLTDVEESKLAMMRKEGQMNASQVVRGLINDGGIIIRHDQKMIIQRITQVHDNFNICSRYVIEQIQQTQNIISKLVSVNKSNQQEIDSVIELAKFSLELQLNEYKNECQRRLKELNNIVDI